jgi:hypothetical protein
MWTYDQHQIDIAKEAINILKSKYWVYLAMEERTRKTGIALKIFDDLPKVSRVLVITPAKAIPGWEEHLANLQLNTEFLVYSMDSLDNVPDTNYQGVIVDEAHNFGSTTMTKKKGKRKKTGSSRLTTARILAKNKLVVFMSATPNAQGYYMLYNQLSISSYSPWRKYKNFFDWYNTYGIPETQYFSGRVVIKRVETKEDMVWDDVKDNFISYTRKDLGFEHDPNDVIHFVNPPEIFTKMYNSLQRNKVLKFGDILIKADTISSVRTKLHQMETGSIKYKTEDDEDITLYLRNMLFKIDYIKDTWGDTSDMVIMYNYNGDLQVLKENFKNALLLQGTANAEGVNLSAYKTHIIYSMDYRTAKYIQRRARMCDLNREEEIKVHYLLVRKAISHQIYDTVAVNKVNYTDKYYTPTDILPADDLEVPEGI